MKILSKYILKEHIGPFFLSLSVITFVMLLDRVLDLLSLIITKHLDTFTIIKVFGLSLPFMLALAIPMSVLVGSIMAFGRLSSDNEITAFKASGVNIYSMMKPIVIVAALLSFFMIYFNNKILPDSNFALKNLLVKIHARRPTSQLQPGLFTKLKNYNFYYHSKDGETGLYNQIIIYDKSNRKFPRTITAKRGKIQLSRGGNALTATLYDGQIHETDKEDLSNHTSINFRKYKIDIPDLGFEVSSTSFANRGDREMSTKDMKAKIAELEKKKQIKVKQLENYYKKINTLSNKGQSTKTTKEINKLKHLMKLRKQSIRSLDSEISKYKVEIEKKFSIAFACLVFILIGAPMGMMTRTHSIGMGFAISTIIFVLYYISLYAGEELADRLIISPFIGMWISNIFFTIIGIYLVVYSVRERKIIHLNKLNKLLPFKRKKPIVNKN